MATHSTKIMALGCAALVAAACSSSGDGAHSGTNSGGAGGADGGAASASAGAAVTAGTRGNSEGGVDTAAAGETSVGGAVAAGASGVGDAGASAGVGGDATTVGEGGEGGLAGAPSAGPAFTITAIDTYVTDSGLLTRTRDLTSADLTLFTCDPVAGTFTSHLPSRADPSKIEYDTLPTGERYVRFSTSGSAYYVTKGSLLDLGVPILGRPDVVAAPAGTSLSLSATQVEAWVPTSGDNTGDSLELFSVGAGVFDAVAAYETSIGANATSFSGVSMSPSSLIESQKGDLAFLTQLTPKALPALGANYSYLSLDRSVALSSLSMTSGQQANVSTAFTTPPVHTLDVDWRAFELAGDLPWVGLGADLNGVYQPHPELGSFAQFPDAFTDSQPAGALTNISPSYSFGDPFPAGWSLVVQGDVETTVPIQLPGAQAVQKPIGATAFVVAEGSTEVSIKPLVGPVGNVLIGGKTVPFVAAAASVNGVGLSPTVTFDAPSIGTATDFNLLVYQATKSAAGATTLTQLILLSFTGHSVTIPPGFLKAGNTYFIKITSRLEAGVDRNVHPEVTAYPRGVASWLSGFFTP